MVTSTARPSTIERELARLLDEEAVVSGERAEEYLHDLTHLRGLRGRADAVVRPAGAEEVRKVVAWCYERGVAVIPRGGGTGWAGGAVPIDGGVVISTERMNSIQRFDPDLWRISVGAGVRTATVHRLARENGLFFAPDPGASEQSQVGGNIATNAAGPHAFKYGAMQRWVLGVEAVVAPGRLVRFGSALRKDVAGYDLRSLMVGSEGTLGIITSAWLRLMPMPEAAIPVVAAYPTVHAGCEALGRVFTSGLAPATLEYLDPETVSASRDSFPGGLPEGTQFLVISEADGSEAAAREMSAGLAETLGPGSLAIRPVSEAPAIRELWRWRGGVTYAVAARRGGWISEDIVVPFERIEEGIEMIRRVGAGLDVPACSWGHAGDGNLHGTFMVNPKDAGEIEVAEEAARQMFASALSLGGSVSGEHGLGWVKRDQFDRQFPGLEAAVHRSVRSLFDPQGLFNPDKKIPMPGPLGDW